MTGHPVAAAALRLHELATAAMADEWSVDFGPFTGQTIANRSITIGMSPEDPTVVSEQVEPGGGLDKHMFEIDCMAVAWAEGSTPAALAAALNVCYAGKDRVAQILRDNPELDGAINWGRITRTQVQWLKAQNGGAGALLLFPVSGWMHLPAGS